MYYPKVQAPRVINCNPIDNEFNNQHTQHGLGNNYQLGKQLTDLVNKLLTW